MMERVLSGALALTLAALLLAVSLQALFGPTPNAVFGLLAAKSGLAFFEPTGRYVVTAVQLAAVALLLPPRTRSLGAVVGLMVSLAAAALHLTPWLGVSLPIDPQVSASLAAGATAAEIEAMNLPTDKGGMFLLALAIAILSAANILVERAKVKALAKGRTKRPAGAFA